jgi:hypothetical protein
MLMPYQRRGLRGGRDVQRVDKGLPDCGLAADRWLIVGHGPAQR